MAVNQNDFVNVQSGTDETYVPLDEEIDIYDAKGAIDDINGTIVNGNLETKIDYLADTKKDIREAIINKGVDVEETDPFRSYAEKIEDIPTEVHNQDKTITENGVYTADSGYTGLGEVTVSVPTPEPVLEDISVNENGTYTAGAGYDGLGEVVVAVPTPEPVLEDMTIQVNGVYTADEGYDGLGEVTVSVPQPEPVLDTLNVNTNGTYTPPANVDGYNEVNVEVLPVLQDKTISQNGTYTADSGYDGLGEVVVNTPVINNQNKSITTNGTYTADQGYSGLGEVEVDVQPTLEDKTIRLNGTYIAGAGYDGFGEIVVNVADIPAVIEPLSVTPTTSAQTISPTGSIDGFAPVSVAAVTAVIDSNIQAGNIKSGVSILGVSGSVIEANETTLNVTPSTSAQTLTPTGAYTGFDEVNVSAVDATIDSNITAANIKSGVSILGVAGEVVEVNNQNKTVNQNGVYVPDSGYTGLGEVTVAVPAPVLSGITVNATTSQQTITPPSGTDGWNQITVNAVTSAIDGNIIPSNIKDGETILGVTGNLVPLRAEIGVANPDTTSVTFTPTSPYNGFSSFTVNAVTAAIDSNIVAGNIKEGITILGVQGTYQGGPDHYVTKNAVNGVLGNAPVMIDLTGVTDLGTRVFCYEYAYVTWASNTTIDMSELTTISGSYACEDMFAWGRNIAKVDMSNVTTISGDYACYSMFYYSDIQEVDLSKLENITGSQACGMMFAHTSLPALSFPALKSTSFGSNTNQFNNMLSGVTGCTVHFPSSLQGYLSQWTSVQNGFGGTNTTILWDLPATEPTLNGTLLTHYCRNPQYDTASALGWYETSQGLSRAYYTSGTSLPSVGASIYSNAACTTQVDTIASIS